MTLRCRTLGLFHTQIFDDWCPKHGVSAVTSLHFLSWLILESVNSSGREEQCELLHNIFIHIVFYVFKGQWGQMTVSAWEWSIHFGTGAECVCPQLASSMEYDSQLTMYFWQDRMGLDVLFLPCEIRLYRKPPRWSPIRRIKFHDHTLDMFLDWICKGLCLSRWTCKGLKSLNLLLSGTAFQSKFSLLG